jgi:hypothetical protein
VILECESDLVSSSSQRDNIVIATASGQRVTIFFLSSCFFIVGWVSRLALDIFYPSNSPYLMNAHLVRHCYWVSRT